MRKFISFFCAIIVCPILSWAATCQRCGNYEYKSGSYRCEKCGHNNYTNSSSKYYNLPRINMTTRHYIHHKSPKWWSPRNKKELAGTTLVVILGVILIVIIAIPFLIIGSFYFLFTGKLLIGIIMLAIGMGMIYLSFVIIRIKKTKSAIADSKEPVKNNIVETATIKAQKDSTVIEDNSFQSKRPTRLSDYYVKTETEESISVNNPNIEKMPNGEHWYNEGVLFCNGNDGRNVDYKKAIDCFEKAVSMGYVQATEYIEYLKNLIPKPRRNTYNLTCPHCGKVIKAEKEWIGQQAECPICNKSFIITDVP